MERIRNKKNEEEGAKTYRKYSIGGMRLDSLNKDKAEKLKKISKDLSSDERKIKRKAIIKEYTKNRNRVIDKNNNRKKKDKPTYRTGGSVRRFTKYSKKYPGVGE